MGVRIFFFTMGGRQNSIFHSHQLGKYQGKFSPKGDGRGGMGILWVTCKGRQEGVRGVDPPGAQKYPSTLPAKKKNDEFNNSSPTKFFETRI